MRIFIVGAGEVGYHIASSLVREGHDLVVVDRDAERVKRLEKTLDLLAVEGDGCDPELLDRFQVSGADRFFAVTNSDTSNILAALTARRLGVKQCVVRTGDAFHRQNPLIATDPGIVPIHPEELVARDLLALTRVPGASHVQFFEQERLAMIHLRPALSAAHAFGKPLKELEWPRGWVLTGVVRSSRLEVPTGNTVIRPGELVYAVGLTERIPELMQYFGVAQEPTRHVVVAGAGQVGSALAALLAKAGISVTVVQRAEKQAFDLAARVPEATVLRGDATDPVLLREAGIEHADYFVATTQNDMTNVLSSLLARELGARMVVALYNRPEFLQVMRASQIDLPLSPRVMVAGTILRTVHTREILSLDLVAGGDAEVVDFAVPAGARVLKRPLAKLGFKDSVVGAVVRGGERIIPHGNFEFEAGDHVLVFTLTEQLPQLERMFRER